MKGSGPAWPQKVRSVLALGTDFEAMVNAYGDIFAEAWLTGGGTGA